MRQKNGRQTGKNPGGIKEFAKTIISTSTYCTFVVCDTLQNPDLEDAGFTLCYLSKNCSLHQNSEM